MSQEEISKNYLLFNIPEGSIPKYLPPAEFAKNFKKCGIYKDTNAVYSTTIKVKRCPHK